MRDGFVKVAAGTPKIRVADCIYNADRIVELIRAAAALGVKVLALPELCLTGYTCGDLFFQDTLLDAAERELATILAETADLDVLTAVGLPVRHENKMYNCAALIQRGMILGLVPKTHIPNHGEFYEARWFSSASDLPGRRYISFAGQEAVELAGGTLFHCLNVPELVVGV